MIVTIALCTRRRPQMLRRTLDAFTRLETTGFDLSVIVVENDTETSVQDLVESYRDRLDITYIHEPRQGLCNARNRSFEAALQTAADWIATTDDDTWPEPDWLVQMVAMTKNYPDAEAVSGETREIGTGNSKWILPKRGGKTFRTGDQATFMSTANFFMKRSLIDPAGDGYRFDLAYNLTGGEDTDFMRGLKKAGKNMVWTNEAIVNAPVTQERTSLPAMVRRRTLSYAQIPSIARKHDGYLSGSIRIAVRILKNLLGALIKLPLALVSMVLRHDNAPQRWMEILFHLVTAFGLALGFFGYRGHAYSSTDGN